MASAKPPLLPPAAVATEPAHRLSRPPTHSLQERQESLYQPTPTRMPGFRCLTAGPTSETIPTISCPDTCGLGKALNGPHSAFARCRSEAQIPQWVTLISTSSAPARTAVK